MSIGGFGLIAGLSTLPQSQRAAATDKSGVDAGRQHAETKNDVKFEMAQGIGATDGEQHEVADRDADGRLDWQHADQHPAPPEPTAEAEPNEPHRAIDTTGELGHGLDLEG